MNGASEISRQPSDQHSEDLGLVAVEAFVVGGRREGGERCWFFESFCGFIFSVFELYAEQLAVVLEVAAKEGEDAERVDEVAAYDERILGD